MASNPAPQLGLLPAIKPSKPSTKPPAPLPGAATAKPAAAPPLAGTTTTATSGGATGATAANGAPPPQPAAGGAVAPPAEQPPTAADPQPPPAQPSGGVQMHRVPPTLPPMACGAPTLSFVKNPATEGYPAAGARQSRPKQDTVTMSWS